MKLSYKIFLYFGTFTLLILLFFITINYYVIQRSLHQRARRDLHQIVEAGNTAVENMLHTAIRNYLRGVVEQDIIVLNQLNDQVQSGRMTKQQAKDRFQKHALNQTIGKSGYIVALKPQDFRIMIKIHPFARNTDCAFNQGCRDWILQKNGYSEYEWKNPEDKQIRKKVSYINYFEPWDWVVGATSYEDEFTQLVKIEDLERFISPITILGQGYFFVLDINLDILVHPELKGQPGKDLKDLDGRFIAREIIRNPGTFFYYRWKNPSEKRVKKKFAYANKIEHFNWYLVATGYLEDVTLPIDRLMRISYAIVVLVTILLTGLTLFFSRSLSRPLTELVNGLQSFDQERKIFKMQSRSVAEIEALGHSIESMTQTLVTSEQEKKRLLNLLDGVINSMPSILICVDTHEKIVLWNDKATQYSGFPSGKALGQPLAEIFPEFKTPLISLQQSISSRPFCSDTCQVQRENRPNLHFAITLYPLQPSLQSAVIRIDDITKQVNMEVELLQSHKMESIGTLAGGIAHDFNNILAAIIGYTELSQMITSQKDEIAPYLDKIFQAGNRARDLVQQILTFSRQTKQELKPLLIKLIVKEVLQLIKASLPSTIEIQGKIESDSLILGDPSQVHQILMNLCINASHAMQKDGGILKVDLTDFKLDSDLISRYPKLKLSPYIHLVVSDTGCGIPPDIMERIFDPFFTTKGQGEGTGLGLAVVHGIIKSLKGIIDVQSQPGKGTRINIFLPLIEAGKNQEKNMETPIPKGSEQILFVDDEPAIVEIGKKILESLGYHVVTRTSGIEALALFKRQSEKFDLVITDMTMPQITGDKLARELCSIKKDIPVILCTGFSSIMTENKAKEMGIKGFLMKPIVRFEMAVMIRKILDETKNTG